MSAIWESLLHLLAGLLAVLYGVVPSYGVAIILLTVLINVVLFPLTLKQTRSMRAMQEIQPEVKRLQKEHKGDREKLNEELMSLYKARGVNPAAGCLPLIVQAPIWFALFSVLRTPDRYVEAGSALAAAIAANARFLGMDLKLSPSQVFAEQGVMPLVPYLALIGVVVASGYYQQKQATAGTGQEQSHQQLPQMQMITKVMPVMFGVFSWGFPTGLVLYFAASNVFRIGQQSFMFWLERERPGEHEPEGEVEGEEEEEEPGAEPPRRKRKKRRKKR